MVNSAAPRDLPKFKQILQDLRAKIESGAFEEGQRLPSENDLGDQYNVSRLTVQRALKELQIDGLVDRRAGSGTYVTRRPQTRGYLFGLLITGLGETEIFEPMCQGMARAGSAGGHALLWGDTRNPGENPAEHARQLCRGYIARGVSGVFFAPVEGIPGKDEVNSSIAQMLTRANIPVVLLDRGIFPYPERSRFDLVGIDNRRAGYRMGRYLRECGAQRPGFIGRPDSAPTVDARIAGFLEAIEPLGFGSGMVLRCDPSDTAAVSRFLAAKRPDGILCANDITAAELMRTLDTLSVAVPSAVRIAGIDDVRYASHLRVPLTTLRQPCQALGAMAVQVMLNRIAQPDAPACDVLIECELIVRESCGELLAAPAGQNT